jgi:hypothetical protein
MVELASQQRGEMLRERTSVRSLSLPPPVTVALIRYIEHVRSTFRSRQAPEAERRVQRPCPRSTPMSRLAHRRRDRAAVRFEMDESSSPADARGDRMPHPRRRLPRTIPQRCVCQRVLVPRKRGPRPGKYYYYVGFNLPTAADGAAAPPARAVDFEGCGRRLLPSPFRACVAPDARQGKLT